MSAEERKQIDPAEARLDKLAASVVTRKLYD